mgnify:CR=1 FL=1
MELTPKFKKLKLIINLSDSSQTSEFQIIIMNSQKQYVYKVKGYINE